MREVILPPAAPAMLDSLRALGYSFESALADILDNSIAAGARTIDIQFRTDPFPYLAVIDDGFGMSAPELEEAMRHGGVGPSNHRARGDLGRFGLGLKTASLSQCRRLTVLTKKDGVLSGATWNLDRVEEAGDWVVGILSKAELTAALHSAALLSRGSGTIVIWERFDRATAGEGDPNTALGALVDLAREHLRLVFHRFLTGDGGPRVGISINNAKVVAFDPYLTSHQATQVLPPETLRVEGAEITLRPYVLPHISRMSKSDLQLAGGEDGLRRNQYFPGVRLAVFIHGCFWHRCPECDLNLPKANREFWKDKFQRNIERDSLADSRLRQAGIRVETIWEHELTSDPIERARKLAVLLQDLRGFGSKSQTVGEG